MEEVLSKKMTVKERLAVQGLEKLALLVIFAAGAAGSLYLLYKDLMWTWSGYDIVIGEGDFAGLALAVISSAMEWLYPVTYWIFRKEDKGERYVCLAICAIAWVVDVGTNWAYLLTRPRAPYVTEVPLFIEIGAKLFIGAFIGGVEVIFLWCMKAFMLHYMGFLSRAKTLKKLFDEEK